MSLDHIISSQQLADLCNKDGEFQIAARFWNGGLQFVMGDRVVNLGIVNGVAQPGIPPEAKEANQVITLSGDPDVWAQLTSTIPPRFMNDIGPLIGVAMEFDGNPLLFGQYYPAITRIIELLRPEADREGAESASETGKIPRYDSPVGRYIHLDIEGHDYRIYYEEAGQGIPLLLQHTAGCHGSQWRHLFEVPEITERFRLIAYDLPFHGKSIPPVSKEWWAEEYKLTSEFVRSAVVELAGALKLNSPVFMGCSVGGVLALDLAYHYPDLFAAVISLEGSLKIGMQGGEMLPFLYHPQISNEFKARLMDGLMSPTSPVAYRKETSQVYAAGWPPLFLGDINYYMKEFDLTGCGHEIDTEKVAVHILSGEYDYSGTMEMGKEAHETIKGSTWTVMEGLGHFPMSENPKKFLSYLLPVLDKVEERYRSQGG